jgi:hypothetical protein
MSDNKDRGISFRRLFFRDSEPSTPENNENSVPEAGAVTGTGFISPGGRTLQPVETNKSLVDDFVSRLHNLLNQNNQAGFDFLEFTETLFEESQNPNAEVYRMVFRIAQKMDKSLTPSRLIESANYYKNLVQTTADSEISKGEAKKQGLLVEKENEKRGLEQSLNDTRSKLEQLNLQILELKKQEIALSNQFSVIDQKYTGQFMDVESKINAIQASKEQVIGSIADVEAGITSNLK